MVIVPSVHIPRPIADLVTPLSIINSWCAKPDLDCPPTFVCVNAKPYKLPEDVPSSERLYEVPIDQTCWYLDAEYKPYTPRP